MFKCKEIQPVHLKGDQSWVFIGRTDVEVEIPILWLPDVKSWLIWKDPDAGKDWGQEEKGTTEDEMVGWHHQLNGHGFGWTPGVGDGQGGLVCCGSWDRRVGHNWATELNWMLNVWQFSWFLKKKLWCTDFSQFSLFFSISLHSALSFIFSIVPAWFGIYLFFFFFLQWKCSLLIWDVLFLLIE